MADLPEYKRTTGLKGGGDSPDFASSVRDLASASWGSFGALGASVAQSASNQMAKQIGVQLGQNPTGDMMPAITDFDKALTESYATQSHATLGLQASKLINDSSIMLAQQPRLSSEMIASAQNQVSLGLKNLYKMAPSSIRPQLEYQYGSSLESQRVQLQNKMIGEVKQDQHDNIVAYSNDAAQQAYNAGATGDESGAKSFVDTTKQMNQVGVMNHTIDKNMGRVNNETVENAYLAGVQTYKAMQAKKEGKLPEFLKNYAEHPPAGMTYSQWQDTGKAVLQNVQLYDSLEKQNQAVILSRLNLAAVTHPSDITGSMLEEARRNLPENVMNDWETSFRKLLAKNSKTNNNVADATASISDPEKWPLYEPKVQYQAMQGIAQQKVDEALKKGQNVTMPEAMAQVAATAASANTKYVSTLNAKGSTNNPLYLQEVGAAIDYINQAGKSQNLNGLDSKTLANVEMFNALKGSHDPVTAAQMAHDTVYNKTDEQLRANENNWDQHLKDNTGKGITPESFALSQANIPVGNLVDPNLVGDFVAQKYHAYFNITNGDTVTAQKLLQDDIAKTFGTTNVNGAPQFDMYPIEKVSNLPDDSMPFVRNDLLQQVSKQLEGSKQLYDSGASSFYWEVRQDVDLDSVVAARNKIDEISKKQFESPISKGIFDITFMRPEKEAAQKTLNEFLNSKPTVIQHNRDGSTKEYELVIQGNQTLGTSAAATVDQPLTGYYSVNLRSDKRIMPLIMANPSSGPIRYSTNRKSIIENYNRVFPTRSDIGLMKLTDNTLATIAAHGK